MPGEVLLERDGLALRTPARFGMVALDEGSAEDERPPAALLDRLAFQLDLAEHQRAAMPSAQCTTRRSRRPRHGCLLPEVEAGAEMLEALCAAAMRSGIASIRAPLLALRVARAAAALAGRREVVRGRCCRGRPARAGAARPSPAGCRAAGGSPSRTMPRCRKRDPAPPTVPTKRRSRRREAEMPLDDLVLAAAQAAMPADLLAQLQLAEACAEGRALRRTGGCLAAVRDAAAGRPAFAGASRGPARG